MLLLMVGVVGHSMFTIAFQSTDIPLVRSERNYIDPTTYDNPERAVLEFTKELDRSCLSFESIIGGGSYITSSINNHKSIIIRS